MESFSIILENITKSFTQSRPRHLKNPNSSETKISSNKIVALENISLKVPQGEMLGIIGLNGSGKTTLLRTISGIYTPDSGKIQVYGKLAPLLQLGVGFHGELDAIENIVMYGMLLGFKKSEILKKVDKIIEFSELEDFTDMKLKNYSAGMRIRLAFSIALQSDPDILLIDEILAVGDIYFREKSYNAFLSYKNRGKTILYTSQNLEILEKLCDRVMLLHKGKNVMIGKPTKVIQKYKSISPSTKT